MALLVNFVSASNKVDSFSCERLSNDCKNKQLSLDKYACNIEIDYHKEAHKLSGKCEFNVGNASKYCTNYEFKVRVDFQDNANETICTATSYPYDIEAATRKEVTITVPPQHWNGSQIDHISPRIEVLREQQACFRFFSSCLEACSWFFSSCLEICSRFFSSFVEACSRFFSSSLESCPSFIASCLKLFTMLTIYCVALIIVVLICICLFFTGPIAPILLACSILPIILLLCLCRKLK